MAGKTFEFPPKLFEKELPFKLPVLIWEKGKWRVEKRKAKVGFPPWPVVVVFEIGE